MPFVISNPHSSSGFVPSTGHSGAGRIRKKDRKRPPKPRLVQNPKSHRRQQKQQRPRSSTFDDQPPSWSSSHRASSLSDIISGIVRHQYRAYTQKRPPETKSTLPKRSATAVQLSNLQLVPATGGRRGTISSSASFSFGFYPQSSVRTTSSVGGSGSGPKSTAIIASGPPNLALLQQHAIAETEFPRGEASPKRASSPQDDEVIDQPDIDMPINSAVSSAAAARVAFGLLDSGSRSSGISRTYYTHMADTTTPSAFLTGLSSQCIHTLYAGSFVVYATNMAADWTHTYYACKGWSVTFVLRPWLTILMTVCCAVGGVCNFLLLYLCIENALRRKWDGEPFRGGCRLICQRLCAWITDFDCFRISFLILFFENAPMTFVNYWFVSSCSVPRPGKIGWTFAFACGATILSILWRGVVTFLAYRNLRCLRRPYGSNGRSGNKKSTVSAAYFQLQQQITAPGGPLTIGEIQHQKLEAKISASSSASTMEELRSLASGDLTNHYDECWPVRMSCWIMYNQRDDIDVDSPTRTANGDGTQSPRRVGLGSNLPPVKPPDNCLGYCCQASCCVCLCIFFYAGMFATGCAPCAYHYTCRRNSRLHRHKFARTCTRIFSSVFNISIVVLTAILVLSLLVVNFIWLSSVHVIGNNRTPPEISQICLVVEPESRMVHPILMTSIIHRHKELHPKKRRIDCKPLFELDEQWGFWWQRSEPGPWLHQDRFEENLGGELGSLTDELAVKVDWTIGRRADETTIVRAQFVHGISDECSYKVFDNWTIVTEPALVELPWPYWTACDKAYVVGGEAGECNKRKPV